jgi:hypothetical protein
MGQPSARRRLANMIGGYYLAQAIYVTAKLDIADRLRDGPQTAGQLARATGTHARSLYRLLRTLAGSGIFAQDVGGRFRLTELAELLCGDVDGSLRAEALCVGETHYAAFGELLHSVQTGRPGFDRAFGMPLFDYLAANQEVAQAFDAALTDLRSRATAAMLDGYDFSGVTRLVDVGGGTGSLLSALLTRYASMRAVLFDLPHVVEQARVFLDAAGLQDRCALVGGDFFASVPAGGEVYLLRHILHDWDDDEATRVLVNCRRATNGAGKLLLVESVIQPGNEPSLGKALDLVMLAVTGGTERTEPEYRALVERAAGTGPREAGVTTHRTLMPLGRLELMTVGLGDDGDYRLEDALRGAVYQTGEREYFLLTQCDGRNSVEAVRRAFAGRFGEPLSDAELDEFLRMAGEEQLLATVQN